jgi:hypothetical protein
MAIEAITYQSGPHKRDLRTVIVEDVRSSVVLLPTGSLDVVMAKLLHGTACRHEFWDEQLGTSGDDFAVAAEQVVARRPITVAAIAKHQH